MANVVHVQVIPSWTEIEYDSKGSIWVCYNSR